MKKTISPDGIVRLEQENGRTLSWHENSGVSLIEQDGLYFKDTERAGTLLPCEDWRLDAWTRAQDLAKRLSLEEIAGLMLYSPHQMVPPMPHGPFPGTFGGKTFDPETNKPYEMSDQQKRFLDDEHIRHILLTRVKDADTSARWNNELQKYSEARPHSIPINISSDPRSGAKESDAEFKSAGSDVSKWPEGLGFAACFDPEVVRSFAETASREYRALGISTALGPQIDLCTEPRWMRLVDTLGEDAARSVDMVRAYCDGMQTTPGEKDGWGMQSVNTMVKHWPGGGTGEGGRDAHYPFGQYNVYPGGNFEKHKLPFTEGAFKLDGPTKYASAVMPYYSVSWNATPTNVGNSYNKYIIRDMLRGECGYQGIVCTDWGITADPNPEVDTFSSRCFGMQDCTEAERHLVAIMNGVDQFGGNSAKAPILEAYEIGCRQYGEDVMRERYELAAARLLRNIFHCGLFEDPYLDPAGSAALVGNAEFVKAGFDAQRRSVVLLKNEKSVLPLKKGIKVYIPNREIGPSKAFFRNDVPAHTVDPVSEKALAPYAVRVIDPAEADVAIVFAESPTSNPYSREDREADGNGYLPLTLQYRPYTAVSAREHSIAGGDFREKSADRSYRGKTNTAYNEKDLDNILECRKLMGTKPVIVIETVSNPMVMSEFEKDADAIVCEFGVSRAAVLDIVFGEFEPSGRLPIQMPKDMDTVERHCEDTAFDLDPYTDSCGHTYDYGYGLNWKGELPKL